MRRFLCAPICAAPVALFSAFVVGCHSTQTAETTSGMLTAGKGAITGTATYREPMAFPPDATFEAVLQDVSRLDAPASAIGRTVIEEPVRVPIQFSISYDSARIDPRRNYSVRTRILDDGRTLWVSDRAHPVLTQGTGSSVSILMRRVGATEQVGPDGGDMVLAGELTYLADVARLTECTSRRIYPVSMEGDFQEMRLLYTKLTRALGAPLYVTFEGLIVERPGMTGTGMLPTVVVSDFIEAWPKQTCATSATNAPLLGTRWHITRIGNVRTSEVTGYREPLLTLTGTGDSLTYSATVGCNGIGGSVTVTGDQIAFGTGTGTMMSCGAPLDSLERRLIDVLEKAVHWQVLGNTLEFEDDGGETVAVFELRRRS